MMNYLVVGIIFVCVPVVTGQMILGPERIPISKFPRPLSTEILSRIANVNGDQDGSSPGPSVDAAPPAVAPIIGGADAAEYEYAWHLLLYYLDYAFTSYIQCGATIVNERTVMTAGHCVSHDTEQNEGFFVMYAGVYKISVLGPLEQEVFADDVRLHKGYRYSGAYVVRNDIALLITDEPFNFTTTAVKPVPNLSTKRGDRWAVKSNNCVSIGWGAFLVHPQSLFPDTLQELSPTNVVTNKACKKVLWKEEYSVTPKMICTLNENAGTCSGDSGGSMGCYDKTQEYYQVGISSWSDCARTSVFTRVSKYRRWINYYKYKV